MVSVDMVDSSNSETDIQDGEGFVYVPKIFTNPNYALTKGYGLEVISKIFIGEYCEECATRYDTC